MFSQLKKQSLVNNGNLMAIFSQILQRATVTEIDGIDLTLHINSEAVPQIQLKVGQTKI